MKWMALDTASAVCGVALAEEGRVVYENLLDLGRTHSETLQLACDRALGALGWRYAELDAFAVTVGPGSFTGLRIAVTAAKTFAFALGKKILPLSSLAALAAPQICAEGGAVLSLLDARGRRVFAGLYRNDRLLLEEALGEVDDYAARVAQAAPALGLKRLWLAGDCAARYFADEALRRRCAAAGLDLAGCASAPLGAGAALRLALRRYAEDPAALVGEEAVCPRYLSATAAEREAGVRV